MDSRKSGGSFTVTSILDCVTIFSVGIEERKFESVISVFDFSNSSGGKVELANMNNVYGPERASFETLTVSGVEDIPYDGIRKVSYPKSKPMSRE